MRAIKAKRLRKLAKAYTGGYQPTTYSSHQLSTAIVPKPGLTVLMGDCTRRTYKALKRSN